MHLVLKCWCASLSRCDCMIWHLRKSGCIKCTTARCSLAVAVITCRQPSGGEPHRAAAATNLALLRDLIHSAEPAAGKGLVVAHLGHARLEEAHEGPGWKYADAEGKQNLDRRLCGRILARKWGRRRTSRISAGISNSSNMSSSISSSNLSPSAADIVQLNKCISSTIVKAARPSPRHSLGARFPPIAAPNGENRHECIAGRLAGSCGAR